VDWQRNEKLRTLTDVGSIPADRLLYTLTSTAFLVIKCCCPALHRTSAVKNQATVAITRPITPMTHARFRIPIPETPVFWSVFHGQLPQLAVRSHWYVTANDNQHKVHLCLTVPSRITRDTADVSIKQHTGIKYIFMH